MNEQRSGPRSGRPADRGNIESATFTRNLRYEFASEEGRALMGSYAISFLLAAAFLLFVYLYPPIEPEPEPRIIVYELPPEQPVVQPQPQPEPEPEQEAAPASAPQRTAARQPQRPRTTQTSGGDVGDAFRGPASAGGVAGNIAGAVRGVDVAGGGGTVGGGGTGTRAVIAGGAGTGTAATAGIGGVRGDAGAAGSIGSVGGTGGVGRATVGVRAPSVLQPPAMGESRDMGDLGTYVRSRQRELQFCYEEHGLKANPNLGGTIHVSIGIAGSGRVTSASVNRRTWSGAGASAVESCVLGKIRAWRFPSSGAGDGVYSFPFNFTR